MADEQIPPEHPPSTGSEPDPEVASATTTTSHQQRWNCLPSPLRLLKRLPGLTRVARLFSNKKKKAAKRTASQFEEELDTAHAELMNHIELIEQQIHAIQQQVLDHLPLFADLFPQHTPGTLHQFQQITMLLNDLLMEEGDGIFVGVPYTLSLEEREQFRWDNALQ